jgi:hypothetical protein
MGSIKIVVSMAYLLPTGKSGTYVLLPYFIGFTIGSGLRMRLATVRCFTKAMKYGNKFIYQTVPRLLTIWLDMGEDAAVNSDECFTKITAEISRTISGVPAFKVSIEPARLATSKHPPVVYCVSSDSISCRSCPRAGL